MQRETIFLQIARRWQTLSRDCVFAPELDLSVFPLLLLSVAFLFSRIVQ